MNNVFSFPMKQPQRQLHHFNKKCIIERTRQLPDPGATITPGARRLTIRRGRTNYGGTG